MIYIYIYYSNIDKFQGSNMFQLSPSDATQSINTSAHDALHQQPRALRR